MLNREKDILNSLYGIVHYNCVCYVWVTDRVGCEDRFRAWVTFHNLRKAEYFAKRYSDLHCCYTRVHIYSYSMFHKAYRNGKCVAIGGIT